MRWRWAVLAILAIIFLIGVVVVVRCGPFIRLLIEAGPAGVHQVSVKNWLAVWEREYGTVHSWSEAARAADVMEYVQNYYVPGPGYRGSARTEAELEAQRARTVAAIAAGLREFTGEDFGGDADRWRTWIAARDRAEGP